MFRQVDVGLSTDEAFSCIESEYVSVMVAVSVCIVWYLASWQRMQDRWGGDLTEDMIDYLIERASIS